MSVYLNRTVSLSMTSEDLNHSIALGTCQLPVDQQHEFMRIYSKLQQQDEKYRKQTQLRLIDERAQAIVSEEQAQQRKINRDIRMEDSCKRREMRNLSHEVNKLFTTVKQPDLSPLRRNQCKRKIRRMLRTVNTSHNLI